jgi:hypothetical protein
MQAQCKPQPRPKTSFLRKKRHRWIQARTRIHELERMGYKIRHEARLGEQLVAYLLESEPLELQPLVEHTYSRQSQDGPGLSPMSTEPAVTSRLILFDLEVRR